MDTEKITQRTEEWFEVRRGRITASMAGAIIGCNPWMNRDDVMRRMVRDWHNACPEEKANPAIAYGVAHEDIAKQHYAMLYHPIDECGFFTCEDWLGASPDGLIKFEGNVIGLEVKCPYGLRNEEKPVFKSILEQPHYYAQVQMQLACIRELYPKTTEAIFFQWNIKSSKTERVAFDEEYWESVKGWLRAFYEEYLIEREEPNCQKYLESKWQERELTLYEQHELDFLLNDYDEACAAKDDYELQKKEALESIVEFAGGKNALLNGRKLTLVSKQGSISYADAIKEIAPDADLEKYRKKSTSYWQLQKLKD